MHQHLAILDKLSGLAPKRQTHGLERATIERFLSRDASLREALQRAELQFETLAPEDRELLSFAETDQVSSLQKGYLNFYPRAAVNPYVPFAAQGPWIVTTCGAVVYDAGGYGMLGFGHNPSRIYSGLNSPQVMANIMTASFMQRRFHHALHREIGKSLPTPHPQPYSHLLCLNSGSEAMTMAARFADLNAKRRSHANPSQRIKFLTLEDSFHGRTDRPAQFSHSSLPIYVKHLHSFSHLDNLETVKVNDLVHLSQVFTKAKREGVFFEAFYLEPVMGEGDPGKAISPGFYRLARQLTHEMGSLLVVDSIQAGLRTHGCLSIIDYPGMEGITPPDIEVFSKALNAGQFPFSLLAVTPATAELYVEGIYGNTMTSNPRALEVATAVLAEVTPALARNIEAMGSKLLQEFKQIQTEFPRLVTAVQGTGLLLSVQINPELGVVTAERGLEYQLRLRGLGVIHGGKNSLRFTPHFSITSDEILLVVSKLREVLLNEELARRGNAAAD